MQRLCTPRPHADGVLQCPSAPERPQTGPLAGGCAAAAHCVGQVQESLQGGALRAHTNGREGGIRPNTDMQAAGQQRSLPVPCKAAARSLPSQASMRLNHEAPHASPMHARCAVAAGPSAGRRHHGTRLAPPHTGAPGGQRLRCLQEGRSPCARLTRKAVRAPALRPQGHRAHLPHVVTVQLVPAADHDVHRGPRRLVAGQHVIPQRAHALPVALTRLGLWWTGTHPRRWQACVRAVALPGPCPRTAQAIRWQGGGGWHLHPPMRSCRPSKRTRRPRTCQ